MSSNQPSTSSRRDFLRATALTALGAPVTVSACADSGRAPAVASSSVVTRPVLRPWAADMVWLDLPSEELPVAYVSMALRQVFVDYEYRDRAAWLLDAHISVSTALWRIPLPGDPEGQPVTPGDELREFEELDMRAWDPAMLPAMDDVRIRRGRPLMRQVDFDCVPGPDGWLAAGPWSIEASDGALDDTTREDFQVVGTGFRFAERNCSTSGEAVQYVGWAVRG